MYRLSLSVMSDCRNYVLNLCLVNALILFQCSALSANPTDYTFEVREGPTLGVEPFFGGRIAELRYQQALFSIPTNPLDPPAPLEQITEVEMRSSQS